MQPRWFWAGVILFFLPLCVVSPVEAETGTEAHLAELEQFERDFREAAKRAREGEREAAAKRVRELYMQFERSGIHGWLASRRHGLYRKLESAYLGLRTDILQGEPPRVLENRMQSIQSLHGEVRSARTTSSQTFWSTTLSSFVIIFREGLEALLVLAAMLAYLTKIEARDQAAALWWGSGVAVVVSLALAVGAQSLFTFSGVQREILEGVTMLLATVVLFYVSYWLISKIEADRWKQFIESRIDESVAVNSSLALAGVAFLVVFREGVETVLFYQALAFSTDVSITGGGGILVGFVVGVSLLVAAGYFILKGSVRIPLRPFFVATSAFLYLMAFKFAGNGIYELQEAGLLPVYPVSYVPDWSWAQQWLGIYPALQPLTVQLVLIALLTGGLLYTFRGSLREWLRIRP